MTIRAKISQFFHNEDGFMGLLTAGLGLASSIFGSKSAKTEVAQANQGFDYVKNNENVQQAQDTGLEAGGLRGALLGLGGDTEAAEAGFEQYRDSTGYQFRLGEGQDAITGNRAARGVLNSGATAKSLTRFSQDFASGEFEKYLGQLGAEKGAGLESAFQVGQAGSASGGTAAAATARGTENKMSGIGGLVRGIGSIFGF